MTAAACTVVGLVALGCMAKVAYAVMKDRGQPPYDRVRLSWRQRATWARITRDTGLRAQLAAAWTEEEIDRTEAEIDRLGRRLREHLGLGEEGGDA